MADEHETDEDALGAISKQQMAKAKKAIEFLSSLDLPCSSRDVLGNTRPHRRVTVSSRPSALGGISPRVSPIAASPTFAQARMSRECTNMIQEAGKALETFQRTKSFPGSKRKAKKVADMLFNKERGTILGPH